MNTPTVFFNLDSDHGLGEYWLLIGWVLAALPFPLPFMYHKVSHWPRPHCTPFLKQVSVRWCSGTLRNFKQNKTSKETTVHPVTHAVDVL